MSEPDRAKAIVTGPEPGGSEEAAEGQEFGTWVRYTGGAGSRGLLKSELLLAGVNPDSARDLWWNSSNDYRLPKADVAKTLGDQYDTIIGRDRAFAEVEEKE